MDPDFIITSPSELSNLANSISSSSIPLPIPAIELQLLTPLCTSSELERSLNCPSTFSCHAYDDNPVKKNAIKVLSTSPLFQSWRKVWSEFPLDAVQEFVFDITLPASSIANSWAESKVYWRNSVPSTGGLAIEENRIWQAVVELATVMAVRSKGEAKFGLKGVEEYVVDGQAGRRRIVGGGFDSLRVTLQRLSSREFRAG